MIVRVHIWESSYSSVAPINSFLVSVFVDNRIRVESIWGSTGSINTDESKFQSQVNTKSPQCLLLLLWGQDERTQTLDREAETGWKGNGVYWNKG